MKRPGKNQLLTLILVIVLGSAAVWYTAHYAEAEALAKLSQTAQDRLLLYESTLHSAINRYRYLPFILAVNPEIQTLLQGGEGQEKLNRYLEEVNRAAGPAALYVMNRKGITRAASNWRTGNSYVGHDYSYRPYFRDVLEGKPGMFFGLGVTTHVPGFFLSHPVMEGREIIGAAVVKVEINRLQEEWREGGETVFVTDANGIIVLATRKDWVYQSMGPHDDKALARIQAMAPYRGVRLTKLPAGLAPKGPLTLLSVGGEPFLMGSRPLEGLPGWRIHFLEPYRRVEKQSRTVAGIALAVLLFLTLSGFLARERHLRRLSRQKALEASRIHQINQQLEAEVQERRRKERELHDTQNELIHAGQMAALGQMAASVAHELNQPLAAIRMFSANSKVMLERGRTGEVMENLETIHELTGRLASLASQLKSFSRKSAGRVQQVDLSRSLHYALSLLGHQAEGLGCRMEVVEEDGPLLVEGNAVRLDQVFVNLLQNSLDALSDSPVREIRIQLRRSGGLAEVEIRDTGPGLTPEARKKLFSPFFTTKKPGLGLGLGLSIIHGIIKNMNGDISGGNLQSGGACFTVRLPVSAHD